MSVALDSSPGAEGGFEQMPGVTPPSDREGRQGFLSDVISELGLVDAETIEAAINESRVQGKAPETILIARGKLSDQDLARAIAERNGLPHVDLEAFPQDEEARTLIDGDLARRYRALPIAIEGRAVVVVTADPLDAIALDEIAAATRRDVIPAIAAASGIDSVVEELPKQAPAETTEANDPPVRLESVDGQTSRVVPTSESLPGGLGGRIVDAVETTLDDVARSEILKALDDATSEIERLSGTLEASEQRVRALEAERDELRAAAQPDN